MQTATFDPLAGETARRRTPPVEQAAPVGDPTDPRYHDPRDHNPDHDPRDPERRLNERKPRDSSFHDARITATPRPTDRPLGSTHDHRGEAFLPADVCGDPPVGHVLGHSRETIVYDAADAEGRPAGHVLGRQPGQQPPPDLGQHPSGHVLGPVSKRSE
jgi:hypothetical protein